MSWFASGDAPKRPFFRTALEELLESEGRTELQAPAFIEAGIAQLGAKGMASENLFDGSQDSQGFKDLKEKMSEYTAGRIPDLTKPKYLPQDIAQLIKEWLRLLPEPIIPRNCAGSFTKVQNVRQLSSWASLDEHRDVIKQLSTAAKQLPHANRTSLTQICVMLHQYKSHGETGELQQERMNSVTKSFESLLFCMNGDRFLLENGMSEAATALIEYAPYVLQGKDYIADRESPEPHPVEQANIQHLQSPTSYDQTLAAERAENKTAADSHSAPEPTAPPEQWTSEFEARLAAEALENTRLNEKIDELHAQLSREGVEKLQEHNRLLREDNEHLKNQFSELKAKGLDLQERLRVTERELR